MMVPSRFLLCVAMITASCVSTTVYSVGRLRVPHPQIQTIAVVELANLSGNAHAGEILRASLATEMLRRGTTRTIEATAGEGLDIRQPVERSRAQALGRTLKVDAVLYGTVVDYGYVQGGPTRSARVPSISVDARLVSTSTGQVLWAAGVVSTRQQLWSYDGVPLDELAQYVARALVADLDPHLRGDGTLAGPAEPVVPVTADEASPAVVVKPGAGEPPAAEVAPTPAPATAPTTDSAQPTAQ